MEYENRDWNYSIKDMIFYCLYRWKKFMIVIVAFVLLFGVVKGILIGDEVNAEAGTVSESDYQAALEEYNYQIRKHEMSVDILAQQVEKQQKYMMESYLMNLDENQAYEANASIFISTDYKILPDMIYQNQDLAPAIVATYVAMLNNNEVLCSVAEAFGMQGQYLSELISVTSSQQNVLEIKLSYGNADGAEQMMLLLIEQMRKAEPEISKNIGQHEIYVVYNSVGKYISGEIANMQASELDYLIQLEDRLHEEQKAMDSIVAPSRQITAETASSLTIVAKWMILGGIFGVFVCAAIVCCVFLFGGKIYSADELHLRTGVKILGSIVGKNKPDFLTKLLKRLEGRVTDDSPENMDLIASNIWNYSKSSKKLLIVADEGTDEAIYLTEAIKKRLNNMEVAFVGSILRDAKATSSLQECDAVLLLEVCSVSRYKSLAKEVERITDLDKSLIGCVMVE